MLKRNLPNSITLLNLLSGCLGIHQLLAGDPLLAPWFIVISGILDFFDGMAARALKVHSPIGKDLDSLADVVSFGVLPGFMAYYLIRLSAGYDHPALASSGIPEPAWLALLIPALSAYRLAKFNHDVRQSSSFIGMPTPANGFFWAGLFYGLTSGIIGDPPAFILPGLTVITALLLVSEIHMFSFKFSGISGIRDFIPQSILLLISVPALLFLKLAAFAVIITAYVLISVAENIFKKPA
ncbi:MAG: CDP-alcohol phosphatidyltransferase family protein [Bacteroidetes bacterium]|nr:CDP-alcohol phosphatidyltransferase family protein [Bacteroidota bacterium]